MKHSILAAVLIAALALFAAPRNAAALACFAASYGSVQAAIDDTAGCAAVYLDPGMTWNERIDIHRDMVILSDGTGTLDGTGLRGPVITVQPGVTAYLVSFRIEDGTATDGGCVYNEGTTELHSMVVEDCEADRAGGAIWSSGPLHLSHTVVQDSVAGTTAGGILSKGDLEIVDSEILRNDAFYAGAIATHGTTEIDSSEILHNHAAQYGAIFNDGTMEITHTEIAGNHAYRTGSSSSGRVGAIMNEGQSARLSISHSTISENSAEDYIGAIYQRGDYMHVSNSTISVNYAPTMGGVYMNEGDNFFVSSTIYANSSDDGSSLADGLELDALMGGLRIVELLNTIIADNVSADCATRSPIHSWGHNLDSDDTCNLVNVRDQPGETSVGLYALGNYGGKTRTHLPTAGSPAVDGGNSLLCLLISGDQRDRDRIVGGACEIGAVERQALEVIPTDEPFRPWEWGKD